MLVDVEVTVVENPHECVSGTGNKLVVVLERLNGSTMPSSDS